MSGEWCILRTAGRSTLKLAKSLTEAGVEAWSPSLLHNKRLPRCRRRQECRIPLMPTFVFAKADNLGILVELSERPGRHEQFRLFRFDGRLPLLTDVELEPLRTAENKAVSSRRRRVYRPGQMVRVPEGSFGGMSGTVEGTEGAYTLVAFGGAIRVKIATFLLRPEVVTDYRSPGNGPAALAA